MTWSGRSQLSSWTDTNSSPLHGSPLPKNVWGLVFGRYFSAETNLPFVSTTSTKDRILEILEEDAKASYAEIADRAGVSKPTVRKYIDRLEEEGVVVGYSADVDPKKLSAQTIALVGIEVASDRYVAGSRGLRGLDAVRELYTSSGDHTLMAEVRAADGDELGRVISEEILTVEGVTAAHPSILQERLK